MGKDCVLNSKIDVYSFHITKFLSQTKNTKFQTCCGCFNQVMDNGHVMRFFFKNILNNWPIWADGPNKLWGIWGVSS